MSPSGARREQQAIHGSFLASRWRANASLDRGGAVERRLLPAVFVVISLSFALTLLPRETFDTLLHEDGFVESVGAIGMLCAAVFFATGFLRSRRAARADGTRRLLPWAYLGLAVLFFFAAGEEISWGQRIFGWGTPEALELANGQDETNLHNLGPLQEGSPWLRTNALFAYFWLSFAVAVPVAVFLSDRVRRRLDGLIPILPVLMAPLFIYNQIASEVIERGLPTSLYHGTARIATTVTEIRETNFAILFAVAAYLTVAELSRRRSTAESG
jgi:hypothetical protein